MNDPIGPLGSGKTPATGSGGNALDLGQAVIVSMPKEVLNAASSAGKAGRILAEVVAQQGVHATLQTPEGAFIIKTSAQLTIGQPVMLRLDQNQLQAQGKALPVDSVSIGQPYHVPLSPGMTANAAPVTDAPEPLPQQYWRGQLAPVSIPEDPGELLHVLQDVYQPGAPLEPVSFNSGRTAPATTLPPSINEGVAKFFAMTQLLRELDMLPPTLDKSVLFAGLPPEALDADMPVVPSKLAQSLQGIAQNLQGAFKDTLTPLAQQATEQAGGWLKNKLPPGMLNQLGEFKDALQKGATSLQGAMAAPQPGQTPPVAVAFAMPAGTSLLQVWQSALNGQSLPDTQAPHLLLNMLGLQKPGQAAAGAQSGLQQLMAQFKTLQSEQAGHVVPTLVLPGNGQRNPVLFSPYGLMFSNTATVLGGRAPLLPGTIIFWQPLGNPQPVNVAAPLTNLPLWPAGKSMPASVFEWPDLNAMFGDKAGDAGLAAHWQQQIHNLIPNMAQPDKLGGSILLLLHALNRASVGGWLGTKTVDALRDADRTDLLAKLVSDFSTASGRVSDPLQPDTQRFVLPMVLPEQMAKMVWQVRRDFPEGGEREPDAQQRKKNTRTHFTVDVPTSTMGDLHMAGTVWRAQLDLNLKTARPLDAVMIDGIRERFQTALEITGMTGQIVFLN